MRRRFVGLVVWEMVMTMRSSLAHGARCPKTPGSCMLPAGQSERVTRLRAGLRLVLSSVLALALVLGNVTPAYAGLDSFHVEQAPDIGEREATIMLDCLNSDMRYGSVSLEVPFSDRLFVHEEGLYSHKLAQASIALAMASFRDNTLAAEDRDNRVTSFLEQAGFGSIKTYGYDQETAIDTVGCAFGVKEIDGATLVAMTICGQGYKNEWLSNFTMGDEVRHQGFNEAAHLVEERMALYLEEQGLSGRDDLKLWCAGFSRAAAVTNLCAADFYDERTFKAGIYAYTFATPRNTRAENWADYPIFNIVGQFDPVTAVALKKWGYERYGTTILTPAQETDSDYVRKKAAMSAFYENLAGHAYSNLPEINQTMRSMIDLFGAVVSTPSIYCEYLQPLTYEIWDSEDILGSFDRMADTLEDVGLADEEAVSQMNALTDTLSLTAERAATGQISGWTSSMGFKGNYFIEHSPDVYLSWMFSTDDPEELYGQACGYLHVIFTGGVDVDIYDGEGRFAETIRSDGTKSYVAPVPSDGDGQLSLELMGEDERPEISAYARGKQLIVSIPKDRTYLVLCRDISDQDGYSYVLMDYASNALQAQVSDVNNVTPEDAVAVIWSPEATAGEDVVTTSTYTSEVFSEGQSYSPAVIARLENVNVFHLSLGHITALGAMGFVLVVALVFIVAGQFVTRWLRKRRHQPRGRHAG